MRLNLCMVLQRTEAQEGDLDNLIARQQEPTAAEYNPVLNGGNLGAKATAAVIEQTDIAYGTVNAATGAAAGGDLRAEWINATAPAAKEIFMSCDAKIHLGILSSLEAVVDNNLADVMSMSNSSTELGFPNSEYTLLGTIEAQAATQGQTIFISAGDSGADNKDQDTQGTATSGINVSGFSSPLVTVAGVTDFSDYYDALEGGPKQSTYWSSTNSKYLGSALGYIPETAWNDHCTSSLAEVQTGDPGVSLCQAERSANDGAVVGGSGGISTHFAVPAWQAGNSGYSNTHRSSPDLAGFAASGFWGHSLIYCDSSSLTIFGCFASAGGTSFVAPY